VGTLGVAASLHLQARGSGYAVWNNCFSGPDAHAICISGWFFL